MENNMSFTDVMPTNDTDTQFNLQILASTYMTYKIGK